MCVCVWGDSPCVFLFPWKGMMSQGCKWESREMFRSTTAISIWESLPRREIKKHTLPVYSVDFECNKKNHEANEYSEDGFSELILDVQRQRNDRLFESYTAPFIKAEHLWKMQRDEISPEGGEKMLGGEKLRGAGKNNLRERRMWTSQLVRCRAEIAVVPMSSPHQRIDISAYIGSNSIFLSLISSSFAEKDYQRWTSKVKKYSSSNHDPWDEKRKNPRQ